MNKMIRKLVAAVMALVLTAVMIVTVSYAWFTISDSPVVEGIQITIGGSNTILIAPDVSVKVADGNTYHYPGRFDSNLQFSQYEQYDYLNSLAGLTPVSTADGVNWYLAETYDYNDREVINGTAVVGQTKPITDFLCDTDLVYANLTPEQGDLAKKGSYVYLDFWVVSPGADYTLRISMGDGEGNSGSYLAELRDPVKNENGKYVLGESDDYAAASARVGFLVCTDVITDELNLDLYRRSTAYDSDYTTLRGMYQQPGESTLYTSGYRFTVYEPNADRHPSGSLDGAYFITKPVGYEGGEVVYADMRGKLAIQRTSTWRTPETALGITLEQAFDAWQTAQGNKLDSMSVEEIKQAFYGKYLQTHLLPYIQAGRFFKRGGDLYAYSEAYQNDIVVGSHVDELPTTGGATEDTYIVRLEKNIPQRIRMFVWLEGQDADCINLDRVVDIALSIELAGGR